LPKERPRSRRKRRTREHVIADLSANHVERCVLLCGHTTERTVHDYGVDLYMATYDDNGEAENGLVLFQLKATDRLKVARDGQAVVFRVERADLDWWLDEKMPVILVVYDAPADIAYWLYVQAHFARRRLRQRAKRGSTVTVHVPRANVLDVVAVRCIAGYKAAVLAQMKGITHHG
jgi:hypothetical protein